MREGVKIEHEKKGHVLLLRIVGRLDALSSEATEKRIVALITTEESNVLLDFTEVDYLSSAGMRMLLGIFKHIRASAGKLAVCSVDDGVMDVLKMSGFDEVLHVFATEDEALRCF
ncbi:MAG: STAS domain-containing protein [Chlamydiales bacterium]|nr:STAS domain-containing protein [Chlamydiales bacterium]